MSRTLAFSAALAAAVTLAHSALAEKPEPAAGRFAGRFECVPALDPTDSYGGRGIGLDMTPEIAPGSDCEDGAGQPALSRRDYSIPGTPYYATIRLCRSGGTLFLKSLFYELREENGVQTPSIFGRGSSDGIEIADLENTTFTFESSRSVRIPTYHTVCRLER